MNLSDLSPPGGIGSSASPVFTAAYLAQIKPSYMMIWNVAPNGGGTVWLNFNGPAVVGAPGSFPLYPGESQIFSGQVPINDLSAIATVPGTPLTVKIG